MPRPVRPIPATVAAAAAAIGIDLACGALKPGGTDGRPAPLGLEGTERRCQAGNSPVVVVKGSVLGRIHGNGGALGEMQKRGVETHAIWLLGELFGIHVDLVFTCS